MFTRAGAPMNVDIQWEAVTGTTLSLRPRYIVKLSAGNLHAIREVK